MSPARLIQQWSLSPASHCSFVRGQILTFAAHGYPAWSVLLASIYIGHTADFSKEWFRILHLYTSEFYSCIAIFGFQLSASLIHGSTPQKPNNNLRTSNLPPLGLGSCKLLAVHYGSLVGSSPQGGFCSGVHCARSRLAIIHGSA